MAIPEVSIILPVYNGGQYLSKAIDSILSQSFPGFELIIINDGSTDNSEQVITAYRDPRIVYIVNDGNRGLIYTLNRGIEEAKGKYIARMDSDDVCLRNRLELQKKWLDENADTAVISSRVTYIDENDKDAGKWQIDWDTTSADRIKKILPKLNCIAHPSVMIRSEVLKAYRYKEYQKNIEDYDLWLRMAADGKKIEKINISLLLYRVHSQSVTNVYLRSMNVFFKHFHCKRKYLYHRIIRGKFNSFDASVFVEMSWDLNKAFFKSIKSRMMR